MPMSVVAHLIALVRGHGEVSTKLDHVLTQNLTIVNQQRMIMTTLADLTAQIDRQNAATAQIAAAQTDLASSVGNVAADIQKLIDQIGTGTPGLSEAEAAAALELLTGAADTLSGVATSLTETATSLKTVADIVPETASGDPV